MSENTTKPSIVSEAKTDIVEAESFASKHSTAILVVAVVLVIVLLVVLL